MAKRHSTTIPPFPDHVSRDYFGAWLSGFVDGEGCFLLYSMCRRDLVFPTARFMITLRNDDRAIVRSIQSFFQCGHVYEGVRARTSNSKPQVQFRIDSIRELIRFAIPHFEQYPLLAKKQRDFVIWREGVNLAWTIRKRKARKQWGRHGGTIPKWSTEEIEAFLSIRDRLRDTRKYPGDMPINAIKEADLSLAVDSQGDLFDLC